MIARWIAERLDRLARGEAIRGNCFVYVAAAMAVRGGGFFVVRSPHPLLPRFVHVDLRGNSSLFCPTHPRRGWSAGPHSLWYEGIMRPYR